ncbi:MAG: hypothetical protein M1814_004797 [Vezdaea aestivalis]|nr:MAG: hypothetical protein M1814_004797 [Vezdaea aestivalis]
MDRVQESVVDLYVRWLASAFVCCAPRARKNSEKEGLIESGLQAQEQQVFYYQQPHHIPPPTAYSQGPPTTLHTHISRPRTRSSVHPSEWAARSRNLASRASSRGSMYIRRPRTSTVSSIRPVISGPSEFRKVDDVSVQMALQRQTQFFCPLQLSIHTPRNALSPLPFFEPLDSDHHTHHTRTTSAMSTTPSEFKIPRKPVPSLLASSPPTRYSVDTRSTPSTLNTEWSIQPLSSRPSLPTSASTQELLAALQSRLPAPPPVAAAAPRPRANTAPSADLRRKSSEAAIRVKLALEERQELDMTLAKLTKKLSMRRKNVRLPEEDSPISPSRPAPTPPMPSHLTEKENSLARSATVGAPQPARQTSLRALTKWLFPTSPAEPMPQQPELSPAQKAQNFYMCRDATAHIPFATTTTTTTTTKTTGDAQNERDSWTTSTSTSGSEVSSEDEATTKGDAEKLIEAEVHEKGVARMSTFGKGQARLVTGGKRTSSVVVREVEVLQRREPVARVGVAF